MHLRRGPVILYNLQNILKTDLPQIFHGLVIHFKTIFCSLVYKCYLWGEESHKGIAKFCETFILNNFLVNNLNLLYSRMPFFFKVFTLISTTTVARL